MRNKGFEIKLNDEVICRSGLMDDHGVITCILMAISIKENNNQEIRLDISGLNSKTNDRVKWLMNQNLNIEDDISIKVIEGEFDTPNQITARNCETTTLEHRLKKCHKLKEELKDFI